MFRGRGRARGLAGSSGGPPAVVPADMYFKVNNNATDEMGNYTLTGVTTFSATYYYEGTHSTYACSGAINTGDKSVFDVSNTKVYRMQFAHLARSTTTVGPLVHYVYKDSSNYRYASVQRTDTNEVTVGLRQKVGGVLIVDVSQAVNLADNPGTNWHIWTVDFDGPNNKVKFYVKLASSPNPATLAATLDLPVGNTFYYNAAATVSPFNNSNVYSYIDIIKAGPVEAISL